MILVTGGTGLVGAHLLYKLLEKGEKVRATYRPNSNLNAVKKVFSYYTNTPEKLFSLIDWVEADITNIPDLDEAFKGVTTVYHCAALISFDPKDYQKLRKINIEGTHNVVNLCIAHKVSKLCYVSSIAAIGKAVANEPITEETPWNPAADNSVYAITKYGAEMEVWRGTQEGVPAIIVNPGVILGEGFWYQGSGSLFRLAQKGVPYYTTGSTGFVDVVDVVNCMIKLTESNLKNERYILISENYTFGALFTEIANKINAKPPTKKVAKWQLELAWRLDWLRSLLTGKKRKLTKQTAQSLLTPEKYSNKKVKDALNYSFIPVKQSIARVAKNYIEDFN